MRTFALRDLFQAVIGFVRYLTGNLSMASKKLEAFREWLTPKRRRRAGASLMIIWMIGLISYPSTYWVCVMIPGIIFFFNAWPPEVHDKR